jgi:cytidylate kinase
MFSKSPPIKLALTGCSGTGKTSLAEELGRRRSIVVRHCGEAVEGRAAELGLRLEELTLEHHRGIDEETVRAVAGSTWIIVEGRFLEHVLQDTPGLWLVELTASVQVRAQRIADREHISLEAALRQLESADQARIEQQRAYREVFGRLPCSPVSSLDTTRLTVEEAAQTVLALTHHADVLAPLSGDDRSVVGDGAV